MKKFLALSLVFAGLLSLNVNAQCKDKKIVKAGNTNLRPFMTEFHDHTVVEFTQNERKIKGILELDENEVYQMVFIKDPTVDEAIEVNIYDGPESFKNRELIYMDKQGIDNLYWSFNIDKKGKYYIEYTVPKTNYEDKKYGCMYYFVGL